MKTLFTAFLNWLIFLTAPIWIWPVFAYAIHADGELLSAATGRCHLLD